MASIGLASHSLQSEGAPYFWSSRREAWVRADRGFPAGSALCECGASSLLLVSDDDRKRWHRDVPTPAARAQAHGTDSPTAALAAILEGIRERAAQLTDNHDEPEGCELNGDPCTGHDAEALAVALERVLELADQHEPGRSRWADPHQAPSWIAHLGEAALSGLERKDEPPWLARP